MSANMFDLTGKNAIVTGAARETGLCYAMARALSEAGARIVILDISKERMERTIEMSGGEKAGFYGVVTDLTDAEDLKRGFDKAVSILDGQLDILVNGADVTTMPVQFAPEVTKKYNAANCQALNITVPDGYEAIG